MAEGAEPLERVLRRELSHDQFLRYQSILYDFNLAFFRGTYHPRDSGSYTQRYFEVIGDRPYLRRRASELPWMPSEPVSPPPTESEEIYEKYVLEGLERELTPAGICRFMSIFNEAKRVWATGALVRLLVGDARIRLFERFEDELGDKLNLLTRVKIYLDASREEDRPVPSPRFLRNIFFPTKFELILTRHLRGVLNEVDYSRCESIWEEYKNYVTNNGYSNEASREPFGRISEVLRPINKDLIDIILLAPWPHLNISPSSEEQATPIPNQITFARGE